MKHFQQLMNTFVTYISYFKSCNVLSKVGALCWDMEFYHKIVFGKHILILNEILMYRLHTTHVYSADQSLHITVAADVALIK